MSESIFFPQSQSGSLWQTTICPFIPRYLIEQDLWFEGSFIVPWKIGLRGTKDHTLRAFSCLIDPKNNRERDIDRLETALNKSLKTHQIEENFFLNCWSDKDSKKFDFSSSSS